MIAPIGTIVYFKSNDTNLEHYLEGVIKGHGFAPYYTYVQFGDKVITNISDSLLRTKVNKNIPIFKNI